MLKWFPEDKYPDNDVSVSVTSAKGTRNNHKLSIRISKRFLDTFGDYINVGVDGNRMYFRPSDKGKGYKFVNITNKSKTVSVYDESVIEEFGKGNKTYTMKYDEELKLHYIERS